MHTRKCHYHLKQTPAISSSLKLSSFIDVDYYIFLLEQQIALQGHVQVWECIKSSLKFDLSVSALRESVFCFALKLNAYLIKFTIYEDFVRYSVTEWATISLSHPLELSQFYCLVSCLLHFFQMKPFGYWLNIQIERTLLCEWMSWIFYIWQKYLKIWM